MEPITRKMRLNRVTQNTVRFAEEPEVGQPETLGQIYVKKWILGEKVAGLKKGDYETSDVYISVTVSDA